MGKFSSELDEAVHALTMDTSWCEEEWGDVQSWGGWNASLNLSADGVGPVDPLAAFREELAGNLWAIVNEDEQGFVTVDYFATPEECDREVESRRDDYETNRGFDPDADDYCIGCDCEWFANFGHKYAGPFDSRDDAVRAVAQDMVDAGYFGDAFDMTQDWGGVRIDDEVRAWHDAGGDKMHPAAYWGDQMLACIDDRVDDDETCNCDPMIAHIRRDDLPDDPAEASRQLIDAYNVTRVLLGMVGR